MCLEKKVLSFECDYSEGAHELILQRLVETNLEQLPGYEEDQYCRSAQDKIRAACACPDASVFFLVGGTQTNAVVIGTMLERYQGVVSASTGHINVHEAGAIEYTGHKVLPVPSHAGKMHADELEDYIATFFADGSYEHMVFPGMVYISQPTEYGTLYSKAEMQAIAAVCHKYELPLFVDGARLGYALATSENDVSLADLAQIADVFYIGGTKCGALCGEAVVFPRKAPRHFITMVKQQGAMLAKGRLLGVQFDTLFTDNLYVKICGNAISLAQTLREMLKAKGYQFYLENPTNQIFVVLENTKLKQLEEHVRISFWEKYDANHTVVRFATSWATTEDSLNQLAKIL